MKQILTLAMVCSLAASVMAQSRSSFSTALISGVMTTQTGNQIDLAVAANPTLTVAGNTYNITEVFAVYALDNNDDFSATGTSQNGWSFNSNYAGSGGIAGWKTNPNNGITDQSLTFNFTSTVGSAETFGYHLRVDGNLPGGGNTGYFSAVPEPASMIAFGAFALAALRRKRK
ncbi:MAG: PEP-CTERM sorting domain-containing protein [Fimbriimonadaceae bacterium]|nr:PEP-CTERM sorting domain-containing protein [Fimbriimonadaceae bacterium]